MIGTQRVVVALGGNALLRRGEPMTSENQRANVAVACERLAAVTAGRDVVVSHGNGPQIGLLALEGAAYTPVPVYPLDVLGAETQGMIGYLIEQELRNRLPGERPVATLLTMVEVDPADPAFGDPGKPIGPGYSGPEAADLARDRGWSFKQDGDRQRRVVSSPAPRRVLGVEQISLLLDAGCVVVCAGGGGIPTARDADGRLVGVEAVIDKDHASGLLARVLEADVLVMATDTAGVYLDFGTADQRLVTAAHPDALLPAHAGQFAAGSMLPKVTAACDFARATGRPAVIGALADIEGLVAGTAGTSIRVDADGVVTAAEGRTGTRIGTDTGTDTRAGTRTRTDTDTDDAIGTAAAAGPAKGI
ncbi:carbamate kinase [Catenulispora yoronensis]|uniref:Carbamate kinase n=1 Tax=Catenulispora yoronensis TaxID=450799 RepID=A0ABP5FA63_9ACTN